MSNGVLQADSSPPSTPFPTETTTPIKSPFDTEIPQESGRFMGEFAYMIFVLSCVISVMILASWFIKKMLQTKVQQLNQTSLIKITESRTLGHRSILHLIEVHGMTILISETPAGVQPLAKFKTDDAFDKLMGEERGN